MDLLSSSKAALVRSPVDNAQSPAPKPFRLVDFWERDTSLKMWTVSVLELTANKLDTQLKEMENVRAELEHLLSIRDREDSDDCALIRGCCHQSSSRVERDDSQGCFVRLDEIGNREGDRMINQHISVIGHG